MNCHTLQRDLFVYPGHPVITALAVLLEYEGRIEEAFAPTEYGWCAALGNSNIRGAGGEVGRGVHLIHHVREGTMTPEEAVQWGEEGWHQGKAGGHHKAVQEGQEKADQAKEELLRRLWDLVPVEKRPSRYSVLAQDVVAGPG